MSQLYCHRCARTLGLPEPVDEPSLSGTQYQLGKFIKHTAPTGSYPLNGLFSDPSFEAYQDHVVRTAASGWYEVDASGRNNMVYFAGPTVGIMETSGVYTAPADTVRIVLYANEYRIHGFPASESGLQQASAACAALQSLTRPAFRDHPERSKPLIPGPPKIRKRRECQRSSSATTRKGRFELRFFVLVA